MHVYVVLSFLGHKSTESPRRDKILGTWVNQQHDLHRTRGLNSDPEESVGTVGFRE